MTIARQKRCCAISLLVIGLILFCVGIVVLIVAPIMVKKLVKTDVSLSKNSFTESLWQNPPFAISMQFWVYNVTNALEVMHHGAKPHVTEKGPYGFRETQIKGQVVYNSKTITYVNDKTYYFDKNLSCTTCNLDDEFTLPNIPFLTVMGMLDELELPPKITDMVPADVIKNIAPLILFALGEYPFVNNVKVGEFLFDGYSDTVFTLINKVMAGLAPTRMGILFGKNHTDDGMYTIHSGEGDPENVGRILAWDGHTELGYKHWWNPKYNQASMINGTDGTLYKPFLKRSDKLYTYVSDICRSVFLSFSTDTETLGLNSYKYTMDARSFDPYLPENYGFCWPFKEPIYGDDVQPLMDGGYCLPRGMIDVSKCQMGSPVVVTMPQFYYAPDKVYESVTGLRPRSKENLASIQLEPTSGILLRADKKVQLNVMIKKSNSTFLQNLNPVIVPIFWLNESVLIDQNTRDYLYNNIVVLQNAAYIIAYSALGVGLLMTVVSSIYLCLFGRKSFWR